MSSAIKSSGAMTIESKGGNVNIVGSKVEGGGDVEIKAKEKVTILSGFERIESKREYEEIKVGLGQAALAVINPALAIGAAAASGKADLINMSMKKSEYGMVEEKAVGSVIKSGGNMTLKAGKDITIAGSQAEASGEATLEAGRNINILSVEQLKKIYEKEESISVSGGGINNIDFSQIDSGRISVELGKGEMRGDNYEEWTIKQAGSSVKAGGKVKATAGGDVNIKGSKVEGEEIEIEAENINIITADNKYKRKETHKDASVTVSAGITNSFVDAYYAGDALVKASEMQARAESDLSKIEKLYESGKASKEAVEDAKLNVTLARVNLASATTNAIASAAGAATSWKTGGVNASLIIDAQINEVSKQSTTVNAMGSMISANKNVTLTAKNDIKQIGSAVLSKQGDISYEAGDEITIKAGENSYTSKEKNEKYNASYAYGTGGYSANAGFNMGGSTTDDIWHTNATVRADEGKISMTTGKNAGSKGDMTIKGANILGKEIDIKVKGDLVQESMQDRHRTDGKTIGVNAGFSGGTQLSSAVTKYQTGTAGSTGFSGISLGGHYGQTKEDAAWVNQQTSIVGSESVTINAGGKYTNKGALTANADYKIDDNGKITYSNDKGKLTINAKAFEYIEIEDHDYKNTFKYGEQISIGKFDKEGSFAQNLGTGFKNSTVTGSLYNQGSKKEQINRATIGKGTITVDGQTMTDADLLGLNRDITKAQEITRDEITNALNAEVTVDVRFWSSLAGAIFVKGKGVKDISVVQDIFTIYNSGNELRNVVNDLFNKDVIEFGKFSELMGKDDDELTPEERIFRDAYLVKFIARTKKAAFNKGDYAGVESIDDFYRTDEERQIKRDYIRDEIGKPQREAMDEKMQESIGANKEMLNDYFNHPGGVDMFNDAAVTNRIKIAKQAEKRNLDDGKPTCNQTMTAELAKYGINLPYYDKKAGTWYKAENQIPYIRDSNMFGEITGTTTQALHNNAYQKAKNDPDSPIIVAIETKEGAWHIGTINPNKKMEYSSSHKMAVPPIYTYVPKNDFYERPAKVGTEHLGWHASTDKVINIQYFEYKGPVITDGKDKERYVPRNKGK